MASKICVACGKSIGLMTAKTTVADGGFVCKKCLNSAGITDLNVPLPFDSVGTAALISRRQEILSQYRSTKKIVKKVFEVDEPHQLFKVNNTDIFEYSDLLNYDMLEDGEQVSSSGFGQAVAGGFLFGPVGAIVGGINGGRKKKAVCHSLQLQLNLRNTICNKVCIEFLQQETKQNSSLYKDAVKRAQDCLGMLQIIANINMSNEVDTTEPPEIHQQEKSSDSMPNISAADEILKFKSLLDSGIITEEEFEAKKRQLLDL